MIVSNMAHVATKNDIIPTFWGTVQAVSRYYNVPQEPVTKTLKKMLDIGYLVRKERKIKFQKTVTALTANWEMLIKDGLRKPETDVTKEQNENRLVIFLEKNYESN